MPYLGKQSEQVGVSIQKYEFLQATDTSSGTTSFSVPSDAGDHVNVWLNGVLLVEGGSNDYTTTNTTVVFGTAPADGDIVRIDVVESFALPDALKSSGDTMTGALKLDGGIKQQTSADLSGTYAYHQLMLSDAFTVAGDVTISDNLLLAKLSDDSNAITISNDTSTRTITGTGSLEASTLAQTPNQSLTGMTGTIGSGVTIETGVTFNNVVPVFHMRASSDDEKTAGSDNKAQLDTIVFESGSYCDTTNNRVTVPRTGYWQINYSMRFTGHQYWTITKLYINGAFINQGMFLNGGDGGDGESHNSQVSTLLKLNANDYIEVWWHPQVNTTMLYSNGDGTHTSNSMCSLSGHFIGAS